MKFHILLDNGHGKETPGKRSPVWPDGTILYEWEYNRRIVKRILSDSRLKSLAIQLHEITPETTDVPISLRCRRSNEIAKEFGKENCLGFSVHCNAANGKAQGWEVHTYLGQNLSDKYATLVWNIASALLKDSPTKMRGDHSDGDPDWDSNFGMLRDTSCPYMLTENLFMDNFIDCKFMLSQEGEQKLIDTHVLGIIECYKYWCINKSKTGFLLGKL